MSYCFRNFAIEQMASASERVVLNESWKLALQSEFESDYMAELRAFLVEESKSGKRIYPPFSLIFHALDVCALQDVKVVVIGQDPYILRGQAHGLSFSVPHGVRPPPSLMNIFKEVAENIRIAEPDGEPFEPETGCLLGWARQGVLLLNSTLTVQEGRSGSHQGQGWERFTDRIVDIIDAQCEHVVFMLWGAYAKSKGRRVSRERHCVLTAAHPSPLAASSGFFGCRHFLLANEYLQEQGKAPINWRQVGE